MPLYLAATPDRLTRARAVTPRLAHVAYRLGPGSELLAAPLPPALRGGLMVLSDWDCPPVEEPDRLARQIARTCLRRGYAGAAADFDPPARPDRLALLEALSPLLASCGRTLYVPEHCPIAAFADDARRLYGIQFHAEVAHTPQGERIFRNFLQNICGCACTYSVAGLSDALIDQVRAQVGEARVLGALSGGVDSSVASVLVHRAVGDRLTCIFVDHGLLRENEAEEVLGFYRDKLRLNVVAVDARRRFLDRLAGVTEPERKRRIIGEEFIRVFEEEAKKLGGADYLLLTGETAVGEYPVEAMTYFAKIAANGWADAE